MPVETEEEGYPILTGPAWSFGIEVPAACIAPSDAAQHQSPGSLLMTPVDPSFPQRLNGGEILTAGAFGKGTADAGPIQAICEAGIAAVVASSFDPTFSQLAREAGLPAVEIFEAMGIQTGEILRVDLEGGRVVNMSSGNRYPIRNLDEDLLAAYRHSVKTTPARNTK